MSVNYAESSLIAGPSGSMADVTSDNALKARPVSEFDRAVEDGLAFAWASATYDYDAHDTILAVENDDTTRDLVIQRIFASSDTGSQVQVWANSSAVTMAGTAVTGVNLNRGSGRVAMATAKQDETGNGEQGGSYTKLLFRALLTANTVSQFDLDGKIVIPYGDVIGLDLTTAGTGANMTIYGYFRDA